jgi:hypothetical protein
LPRNDLYVRNFADTRLVEFTAEILRPSFGWRLG